MKYYRKTSYSDRSFWKFEFIYLDGECYDLTHSAYKRFPPTESRWSGLSYKVWDDIKAMEGYRKGAYRLAVY